MVLGQYTDVPDVRLAFDSFNKYLLSIYYLPGTVLSTADTEVSKRDKKNYALTKMQGLVQSYNGV